MPETNDGTQRGKWYLAATGIETANAAPCAARTSASARPLSLSLSDVSAAGIILDSFQVQRLALARAQAHHTKDLLMFISLYYITGDCARTL